jgi:hypothetical protein
LDAPGNAANWFMPFAFGAMTGVLVNRYYAPPTRYVSTVHYKSYLSPVVVQQYRVVNPRVIEVYHRAPLSVRSESHVHGPVRFAPSQGIVTARPHTQMVVPGRTFTAPPPAGQNNFAPAQHRLATPTPMPTPAHTPVHTPMPAPQRLVSPAPVHVAPAQIQRAQAVQAMPPAQAVQRAPAPAPAAKRACNPNLPKSAQNCT